MVPTWAPFSPPQPQVAPRRQRHPHPRQPLLQHAGECVACVGWCWVSLPLALCVNRSKLHTPICELLCALAPLAASHQHNSTCACCCSLATSLPAVVPPPTATQPLCLPQPQWRPPQLLPATTASSQWAARRTGAPIRRDVVVDSVTCGQRAAVVVDEQQMCGCGEVVCGRVAGLNPLNMA